MQMLHHKNMKKKENKCMEAILKFRLPEEAAEHLQALNGGKWAGVVWELDRALRSGLKYGHDWKTANEALEAVRDGLAREMEEEGLGFDAG